MRQMIWMLVLAAVIMGLMRDIGVKSCAALQTTRQESREQILNICATPLLTNKAKTVRVCILATVVVDLVREW